MTQASHAPNFLCHESPRVPLYINLCLSPTNFNQKSPLVVQSQSKKQNLLSHISRDIIIMSSSKSCVIMHDAADVNMKRFQSSSNLSIIMYVDGVLVSNSNLPGKHDGSYSRAPTALEDGDGDDDDNDGDYDYAPAA
ncbi:hypothetical protein PVK06_013625 [Gossypium arboreum]|uniref:Uncharacterized protein n=2 Tax=Gossypium TaxID=3633 RepID=A0ABR0PSS8_GOSAR|nr:hypothetical protein PVK06_013625 [Gossypium arboreum]